MCVFLVVLLVLVVLFLTKRKYDNQDVAYKGEFYHKHGRLSQFLLHKWTTLEEPYRPTFWATNAHVQSLLYLLWPRPSVPFRREYLQLEDRGVIALDWITSNESSLNSGNAILIVIPGLTCSIREVAVLCARANEYSFRFVVFNRRGHGGSALTTACLQTALESRDLDEAISYIHSVYPCAKLVALAYSSGGAMLLSYLEETKKPPLSGAVCISPCYEMDKGLENVLPPIYEYFMTKRLVQLLKQHPGLASVIDYDLAVQSANVREFKQRVYEPLLEFDGYRCGPQHPINNNFNHISRIRVPTLCISSLDDPICTKETIPFTLFQNSSNFYLITCERGGHCGFFYGDLNLKSWADHLACTFLDAMINFNFRKSIDNPSPSMFPHITRDRSYTQ